MEKKPENQEPLLLLEQREGIARLTLNRPERRNTLSKPMLLALQKQLNLLEKEQTVRAIILAANGPVFSSGHDLKELSEAPQEEVR